MTSSPMLASIALFAGRFAIKDYAYCQGQSLPVTQNQALFSLISNKYGGDAQKTFMLPNLGGVAIGHTTDQTSSGPLPQYKTVGSSTIVLNPLQMPAHTHPIAATAASSIGIAANNSAQATTPTPGPNNIFAAANQGGSSVTGMNVYAPAATTPVPLSVSGTVSGSGQSTAVGSGTPVSVMQPSIVMGYQICTSGYYPPRP